MYFRDVHTGAHGLCGHLALNHVVLDLEAKLEFALELTKMIHSAKEMILLLVIAMQWHVQHGPGGLNGQFAAQNVVLELDTEKEYVIMVILAMMVVLEKLRKLRNAPSNHVHPGRHGEDGLSAAPLVDGVHESKKDPVIMGFQETMVVREILLEFTLALLV